ncbi:MAG: transcriptional regulator [Desulfurococcaceae archaeon]|nr:transcriptional regulator [Desulfurococcaceae archaeon]
MSNLSIEEVTIDFTGVPTIPTGKRNLQKLELALIVGTLYSPEVIELIKDPVERATWIDSLAIAAGALARQKAGYSLRQIAEELGRSEVSLRAHLSGKTKVGQLVLKTYERLVRGELKVVAPFTPLIHSQREMELEDRLRQLELEKLNCQESLSHLSEELSKVKAELEIVKRSLEEKEKVISEIKEILKSV